MPETKNSSSSETRTIVQTSSDELSELLLYVWLRSQIGEAFDPSASATAA